jgi:hypothetical protein
MLSSTYTILLNIPLIRLLSYVDNINGNNQCAIWSNKSNADHIFCIHQMLERKPMIQLGENILYYSHWTGHIHETSYADSNLFKRNVRDFSPCEQTFVRSISLSQWSKTRRRYIAITFQHSFTMRLMSLGRTKKTTRDGTCRVLPVLICKFIMGKHKYHKEENVSYITF